MKALLSYNFYWHRLNKELFPLVVREFLDNGADRFVFTRDLVQQVLDDPEKEIFLRNICRKMGVNFVSMHGLCGKALDLNVPNPAERKELLKKHIRAMELAQRFGSQTYTVHVGAYYHCVEHVPLEILRDFARNSLDILVPEAEKIGIVIAVENSFEPSNSVREVIDLVTPYLSSTAIGVCYDTGHANCIAAAPWKKMENYFPYVVDSWWENGIVLEEHALETVKDQVVTCHMHDNSGYADQHRMPGDGTVDWKTLIPKLKACPRMLEFQTEVNMIHAVDGTSRASGIADGYSIRRMTDTFRNLMAESFPP